MLKQQKKKDLGFADALATVSIRMVFDGPGGDLIEEYNQNPDDQKRFNLALELGHVAMATAAIKINLTVDLSRKTEILEKLRELFIRKMSKQARIFPLSQYVVEEQERINVTERGAGIDTDVDMKQLLFLIYDDRIKLYESAIREGLELHKTVKDGKINPFKGLILAMARHVYGEHYEKNPPFFTKLSSLMFASLQSMMFVCEEYK